MTTPGPKISVGMPVYNAGRYLAPAIESILCQSFSDLELVISDNVSTDGSYEVCREYAARDPRIRLVRSLANLGGPWNYNSVARLARAPYLKWASANDLIHVDFLKECARVLDQRPDCVLCYPRTRLFAEAPEDGTDYEDGLDLQFDSAIERFAAVFQRLRLNNAMNGLIRRDALAHLGFMPLFEAGDISMIAELSLMGTFVEIPSVMLYRRMTPETATRLKSSAEARRHAHPRKSMAMLFPAWRQCAANTRAILRNRLPLRQRARGLLLTTRQWIWARQSLFNDICQAARYAYRRDSAGA